ncbi:snRNA-activating protein complex subunit 4 isoform X2 [Ahaetulla prasina]|uniref:snRNA-activating protein complex subunit 4 isoform X2 n=1 Tax=Ahaetulla prasina TaxID=499056 RepID=UPI002649122E|nr:snRNA-activating protein complex subunit 4 isoform X2 [Ahaetulla prasina]
MGWDGANLATANVSCERSRPGDGGGAWRLLQAAMELEAEREKIRREIEELERSLGPVIPSDGIGALDSSLESGSEEEDDVEEDESDTQLDMEVDPGGEKGDSEEDEEEVSLPQTPETCLQMNLVYQEVMQEKIEEINTLLAQNKKQQEKLTWELAGTKGMKSSDGKSLPANMFLGHFMKPYFKDKTSGFGPPANDDTREKARQGIKSFEELVTIKWKSREKLLLQQAIVSDRLQHLLQPKLLKVDYLNEKREKSKDEMEKQILAKQIQETEREISEINVLPEEALLGNRHDEHDWDKIANINFEGTRNAKELRKYWQNCEHPNINKKEWSEEEVEKLKEIAARHGGLHWEAVAQELGTQRTAFQCLQKFQSYNKDFKRSEWSPEEDQMLRQLVQEMRVGNHIPYRKMAYYMEGRDSAQLIYRWTKRVDPNLKRGAWTPKEDALLLKAVAKYGERDWYKIRAEVPGRNDLQCRDRYLHSLHNDIKKGKWSEEEEKKLIELTEKYGRGHWAKIASELPHRSRSQCLSKWKILLGYRRHRRKKQGQKRHPRYKRVHRWSSSPSESSSEYSDLDLDVDVAEEEEKEARPKAHRPKGAGRWRVPSLDLWVPARKDPSEANPGELPAVTLLSKGFDVNRKRRLDSGALLGPEEGPRTEDPVALIPEAPELAQMKGNKNSGKAKDAWRVSMAYVKSVLRRNSYEQQRRKREIRRKKRFASSSFIGPRGSQLAPPATVTNGAGRQKDGMRKTTLYRRLMVAVTPWAGNMVQEWALRMKEAVSRKSKADVIFRQLQTAHLTSTPLFTFLIQLLHIDVDGCMGVIQKRKSQQPELLKAIVAPVGNNKQPGLPAASGQPNKKLIPLKAKEGPVPTNTWKARLPPGPTPKLKTVSELLREKRLLEQTARKGAQKKIFLAPQLLLSTSVMVPQTRGPITPLANGPHAPLASQVSPRPPPASASRPLGPFPCNGDKDEAARAEGKDGSQESFSPQGDPEVAGAPAGPPRNVNSTLADALCPSPASGALPHLVAAQAQPSLPISWVLTPQGLLPITLVSIPSQGTPLASGTPPNPSQPAETSVKIPTATTGVPVVEGPLMQAGLPSGCPQSDAGTRLTDIPPPPLPLLGKDTEPGCPPSPAGAGAPSLPCTVLGGAASSTPNSEALPPPHPNQGPAALDVPSDPALQACPMPCPPQEGAPSPLSRLLSLEAEPAVKAWAKESREVRVPSLGRGLPYLPPFLCSLKTLSALLLNKRSLEQSAASLLDTEGQREEPSQPDLEALRHMVRQKLQDNPAYQLLRERFLAAFSFPAALAALPPPRVATTLSGGKWWESSQGEDSCSSLEEEEEEEEGEEEAEREPLGTTRDGPAETMEANEELEKPETDVDSDQSSPARTRRSRRLQKRGVPL